MLYYRLGLLSTLSAIRFSMLKCLILIFCQIAAKLRVRAEEVVFSDFEPSGLEDVNYESYQLWVKNEYWIAPWWEVYQLSVSSSDDDVDNVE